MELNVVKVSDHLYVGSGGEQEVLLSGKSTSPSGAPILQLNSDWVINLAPPEGDALVSIVSLANWQIIVVDEQEGLKLQNIKAGVYNIESDSVGRTKFTVQIGFSSNNKEAGVSRLKVNYGVQAVVSVVKNQSGIRL